MAGRYEETKAEIDANTERVRSLVSAEDNEAARELTAETEQLIKGLPKNQQKHYADALEEAGTPAKVYTPVPMGPTPYNEIEGVPEFLEETARHMADGVRAQMEGAKPARRMAEGALQMRLRIPNPAGLPDLSCTSQEGRNAQSAMYRLAGEQVEGDRDEVAAALERLASNVRDQMGNVLPEYLRGLDDNREEAERFFPMALEAYPGESPTEAVYRHYQDQGYELSRHTDLEKRRMKRELKNAQRSGEEVKVRELESALGIQSESDPERTLSTDVSKLRRSLARPAKHLDVLETASPEMKAEVRETAKEARALAEQIIEATQ